ncbi:hypothetical protein ACWCQZ_32355 [Streptomyces sp. NPDC002285]
MNFVFSSAGVSDQFGLSLIGCWTVTSTVATEPINERPASSPQRFTFSPVPPARDIYPFTADPVSGKISCSMIPENAPQRVKIPVTGEDGYGPLQSVTADFEILIQGEPP